MIDRKRAKVLQRRMDLRKQRKQDRLADLVARKAFAEAHPVARLRKERIPKFLDKVRAVLREQEILHRMATEPNDFGEVANADMQRAVQLEIQGYKNDPAVMAAVERRRNV